MMIGKFTLKRGFSDAAKQLLDYLYRIMQIDDRWSVREDHRFTWWGYNLAQRVLIEPVCEVEGGPIVSVRIETDCLRRVPDTEQTASWIDSLNHAASLSGWVWDKERRRVKLVCSLRCDEENLARLQPMLASAMAIQCADAHMMAPDLAKLLHCGVHKSCHPSNGRRPIPDDMLFIWRDFFAGGLATASFFTDEEFELAAEWARQFWAAFGAAGGLTAEFPFWGSTSVLVQAALGQRSVRLETALLQASCRETHPVLGRGLLLTLRLPLTVEDEFGRELAVRLNAAEAREWSLISQLGGWCWDSDLKCPMFVSFIPEAAHRPGNVTWYVEHMACRSIWAHNFVTEKLGFKDEAPEIGDLD